MEWCRETRPKIQQTQNLSILDIVRATDCAIVLTHARTYIPLFDLSCSTSCCNW